MDKTDRRKQILDSALEVFADKGYHDANISDIIARARIARGTFYLYFTSKRAIFDAILDDIFVLILAELHPVLVPQPWDEAAVVQQVRENATRLTHLMLNERNMVRVLMTDAVGLDDPAARTKLTEFYSRLAKWVAFSLNEGIQLGIVRPCETLVAAHALIGMLRGMFWAWVEGVLPLDETTLVNEIFDMIRLGILHVKPVA